MPRNGGELRKVSIGRKSPDNGEQTVVQSDLQAKLKRTKEHWENPDVESLKDSNLRVLENDSIISSLRRHIHDPSTVTLADFGCGDGYDTELFSSCAAQTVGFDYSREMLSRASQRQTERLRFAYLDLISDDVQGNFDAVVTKRFIINLGDWSIQSRSIEKIAKVIAPGGLFVMLECYRQGLEKLNRHRSAFGLPSLTEPTHNGYLDVDETMTYLTRDFSLIETMDFSTYYYFTRCLSPQLAGDNARELDEKMRFAAESDDVLQGSRIGPQTLVCLRKN